MKRLIAPIVTDAWFLAEDPSSSHNRINFQSVFDGPSPRWPGRRGTFSHPPAMQRWSTGSYGSPYAAIPFGIRRLDDRVARHSSGEWPAFASCRAGSA